MICVPANAGVRSAAINDAEMTIAVSRNAIMGLAKASSSVAMREVDNEGDMRASATQRKRRGMPMASEECRWLQKGRAH